MSKVKDEEIVEKPKKLVWKDVRESLIAQRKGWLIEIDALTKKILKAEGAIEVHDQMNPEENYESI